MKSPIEDGKGEGDSSGKWGWWKRREVCSKDRLKAEALQNIIFSLKRVNGQHKLITEDERVLKEGWTDINLLR